MTVVTTFNVDRLLVEFEVAGRPRPHDFTMEWKGGRPVPKPNRNLANDVTVAKIDAAKLHGPNPGVKVSEYAI